ncbi:peptidase inhibitor family I36 protein [Actinokineospora cianjurensis]|uniref:Peptidase inhibitor family I36 n=1 Tax=Actinokineospora cianjurensis TaxID=585224 RepID=A0A421BAW7_9PSEU|nr:peptidase inhibitor family I36 protein [Actinokineospora cianjurensis]RLK61497.1 peptidase inhibitor family I36 [Actinokineospora cianjurensis]
MTKGIIRTTVAAAATVAFAAISVTPASAATARNGICEVGEFCLYWGQNRSGSVSDFATSIPNYGDNQPTCYEYKTPNLPGYGLCVKNNATSAWNRRSSTVTVYFNSNYGGASDPVGAGQARDLASTYANNASHLL